MLAPNLASKYGFLHFIILALAFSLFMWQAEAANCSVSPVNVGFGGVDSMLISNITISPAINISCIGYNEQTEVSYCLALSSRYPAADAMAGISGYRLLWLGGAGSSGAGGSYLPFNFLTSDNKIWGAPAGDPGDYGVPIAGAVQRDSGSAVYNLPFSVSIGRNGMQIPAGSYSNSFAVNLYYYPDKLDDPAQLCTSAAPEWTRHETNYITVSAAAKPACNVRVAQNIDFGKNFSLDKVAPAQGAIQVRCGGGTNYSVGLSAGNNAENGRRAMGCYNSIQCGSSKIYYDIYQDAAHTRIWNNTWDSPGVRGGSFPYAAGSTEIYNAYAALYPGQSNVPPGVYRDQIRVEMQVSPRFGNN